MNRRQPPWQYDQTVTRGTYGGPPYDRLFFDCDSTLCTIEGLDCLAERDGLTELIKPVTAAAMNGGIDFTCAYAERLALLQPDQAAIDWLAAQYRAHISPGATQLIQHLQQAGKQVHIVSGGILQAILPLSPLLGIPVSHIHAVRLRLDSNGRYIGFDEQSPLTRQHGKATLIQELSGAGERTVFIGDGVTDLEASATGADFIGFGGVVRRPAVEHQAARYYPDADLAGLLPWLLSAAEPPV